jgi:16S rRNA (guanine966-N2)-methyltransferase
MRITGGSAKGHKIKVPSGGRVRPAQDIVRQAIFNIIGEYIIDAKVLDLFAGSGSLGIEALSRGAAWCDFVDHNKKCSAIIKENLLKTHFDDQAKVYVMDAKRFIITIQDRKKYDFIFLSPPYARGIDVELLEKMAPCLQSRGLIIFDHYKKLTIPTKLPQLNLIDQRTYGAAKVSFLQKQPENAIIEG